MILHKPARPHKLRRAMHAKEKEFLSQTTQAIVVQPTTFCNLNCRYCYLPNRHKQLLMDIEVAKALADQISSWELIRPVCLIWHGGEPLATGMNYFESLIQPFRTLMEAGRVIHEIQTNATLITNEWC